MVNMIKVNGNFTIVNVSNQSNGFSSNIPRKSRYDNEIKVQNNTNFVPFHSQIFEEGSFKEEALKRNDKSEVKIQDNKKSASPSDQPKYEKIVKLDLREIDSFLPSIHQSKNSKCVKLSYNLV